jgi:hypothetical protein
MPAIHGPAGICSCNSGMPAIHGPQKESRIAAAWESVAREGTGGPGSALFILVRRPASRRVKAVGTRRPPLRDGRDYGVYVAVSVMPEAAV